VAVFISQRMYMEETFQMTTRRLDKAGYKVVVTAKDTSLAIGMDQSVVRPDMAIGDCRPSDFAALVVINGSGIATYWQDSLLLARCREFAEAGKVLGSVGIASICLAGAGVLKGHKATILPERYAVRQLLAGGARYWPNPVVTDRNVITASETEYARKFVDVLIRMLDRNSKQR
jgi:putative intracellular protease/amidase